MKGTRRPRLGRGLIAMILLVPMLLWLSGCWLFNVPPIASFTASALSGAAPLTINFSAILSEDEDGIIAKFEWDFGDGSSGSGESVSHTFTAAGTFTVVLRVTDDDGETDTAQKTLTVNPASSVPGTSSGPTATFTATPLTGPAALTVTFNASASAYAGHAITAYFWTFGDGTTGTGITTTHTYAPLSTTSYNVVLRIIASDNTEGTATQTITVTVTSPTQPSTAPTASFTASPETGTAPKAVEFDPGASSAASGNTLKTYVWNFGDGSSQTLTTAAKVTHTYYTAQSSQNFTIYLTVIDDKGGANTYSRAITVKNYLPVAGFEVQIPQTPSATPVWKVKDLNIYEMGTATQTVSVTFRSLYPTTNGTLWKNVLDGAFTTPNESTANAPANFETTGSYSAGDKDLSYDVEGHNTGAGWGVTTYLWNYGDATTATKANDGNGGCAAHTKVYTWTGTQTTVEYTVTLEVVDALGGRGTITRKIILHKDAKP